MTRQMLDSINAARLPVDAVLVGAYVDGHYANEAAVRARCPQATVVTITVLGTAGANVADCEPGDLTPSSAADWAAREIAAGRKPTLYCNLSTWPSVQAEVAKRRITVSYWIAHYDGLAEMIGGAIAKQYQERTDQNLDYGIAADYWPGVDPDPLIPPALPNISQEAPVTPADIAAIAKAVVDQTIARVMEDLTHPHTLVNIRAAIDAHAASSAPGAAVNLDALAAKIADLLAARLAK